MIPFVFHSLLCTILSSISGYMLVEFMKILYNENMIFGSTTEIYIEMDVFVIIYRQTFSLYD